MIASWVDVAADIAAINHGDAARAGNEYSINGRRYEMEAGGRMLPIDGPELYPLTRPGFRALGVYNRFGLTARSELYLDLQGISQADRLAAQEAWRAEHEG